MKPILKFLALLYFALSVILLTLPMAGFVWMFDEGLSPNLVLGGIGILVLFLISVFGITMSLRYLKKSDESSAINISLMTGLFVWGILNIILGRFVYSNSAFLSLVCLIGTVFAGIEVHLFIRRRITKLYKQAE